MLPARVLFLPFMPEVLKELGHAKMKFRSYTENMLSEEGKKPSGRGNMMSFLVKESDFANSHNGALEKEDGKKLVGLTADEIIGNLFLFTAAGFDTTANTMGYALLTLAMKPKLQDWLCEEIDEVLKDKEGELVYNEAFPRLVRCLALMVSISQSLIFNTTSLLTLR